MRRALLALLLLFPLTLAAQGFQSLSVSIGSGARALGMGGAFIAIADDATASSWNPAGLCVLTKPEASVVWKARNSARIAVAAVTQTSESSESFASRRTSEYSVSSAGRAFDFASITYPINRGRWRFVPQFNYQRVLDFDVDQKTDGPIMHTQTETNQDGRTNFTQTENIRFRAGDGLDLWAASFGITFHPKIYFGFALNWWSNHAATNDTRLEETLFCTPEECIPSTGEFRTFSDQRFDGFNFNIGTLWKPLPHWSLGAVFKSPFSMKHQFHAESTSRAHFPSQDYSLNESYNESGTIEWPRTAGIGVAYNPIDVLTVSVDQTWSNWSNAKYDFRFQYNAVDNFGYTNDAGSRSVIWPTNFDPAQDENIFNQKQLNTYQTRIGTEYVVIRKWIFPLRFGYYQDRQYLKDGDAKPIKNSGLTFGGGVVFNNYQFDAAIIREKSDVTGCNYTIEPPESGGVQSCRSDQSDTFRATRIYVSMIYRL